MAIWLSNPCSERLENGRLSGSAQMRNGVACAIIGAITTHSRASLRKREYIKSPSRLGCTLQIAHCNAPPVSSGVISRVQVRVHNRSRPAAYARQNRNILLSVRTSIRDGLSHNSRPRFKLPERLAGAGVRRPEPPVQSSVEHQVTRRRNRPAPDGELVRHGPHLLTCNRIPRHQLAFIASGASVVAFARANIRSAGNVVGLAG